MSNNLRFVTVSPADRTLFHLAAKYYGDATKWLTIAKANGFSGPTISTVMTIYIPTIDPKAGGGIGNQ